MKMQTVRFIIALVFTILAQSFTCSGKVIISDSVIGMLPKNSIPALAITIDQGAEAVHLELVMTADNQVIVLEDTILNHLTDVATVFPERVRADGTFQTLDFTLAEIKQLSLRPLPRTDSTSPDGPELLKSGIRIPTLFEALSLVSLCEKSYQRPIGIFAELKKSWLHSHENKDLAQSVLAIIENSISGNRGQLYLASFDPDTLQAIHNRPTSPANTLSFALVQLIDKNNSNRTMRFERGAWSPYNYDWMFTKFGLKSLSSYASVIALRPEALIDQQGSPARPEYLEDAHILGLQVFCHSIDQWVENLPAFTRDQETLFETFLFFTAEIDGLITGNSVLARQTRDRYEEEQGRREGTPRNSIEILLENVRKELGSNQDNPLLQKQ